MASTMPGGLPGASAGKPAPGEPVPEKDQITSGPLSVLMYRYVRRPRRRRRSRRGSVDLSRLFSRTCTMRAAFHTHSVKNNTQVLVNLRNNHKLLGHVRAFDRHCNLVMENVRELWTEVPKSKKAQPVNKDRKISKLFVRGDSVVLIVRVTQTVFFFFFFCPAFADRCPSPHTRPHPHPHPHRSRILMAFEHPHPAPHTASTTGAIDSSA